MPTDIARQAELHAFVQVIAWSGAGVDDYPAILPNGSRMYTPGEPAVDLLEITPEDPILFSRVIAADNTSVVMNYSSWVPQVGQSPVDFKLLLPFFVFGLALAPYLIACLPPVCNQLVCTMSCLEIYS